MTTSAHDMLVLDLASRLHGIVAVKYFAVPEVTVLTPQKARFDLVAIDCQRPSYACVFEIKTSREDAQRWLRAERWRDAAAHGAGVVLAYPKSLGRLDIPNGVVSLLNDGHWNLEDSRHRWCFSGPASAELLFGMLRQLRNNVNYWSALPLLGKPLIDSVLEREVS